ncbi:hypothetical protein CR513_49865, partial [Mucuna pruriens]
MVGSWMYAQTCTRPYISFDVGMLGRYQSNPRIDYLKAAKKVHRYLQGTKDHMLAYRRPDYLEVIGYLDSNYARCVDSRISTFGYIFLLAGRVVSWKSAKQFTIATSTMEVEFVACFEATIQTLWLRNFTSLFGIVDSIPKSLKVYCDSFAIVFFSKNDKYSKRIKHMDMKNKECQLSICPLTKGLPPKTFIGHVERVGHSHYMFDVESSSPHMNQMEEY